MTLPSETSPDMGELKILLVEDGRANQRLALGLLRKWGHDVTVAENGRVALLRWRVDEFDVVLMDLQMPEMDGFEATRQIREEECGSNRRQPIIAMTAHNMTGDRERCLEAGMDGYVSKPIRREALLKELAGLVGVSPSEKEHTEPPQDRSGDNMTQSDLGDPAAEM